MVCNLAPHLLQIMSPRRVTDISTVARSWQRKPGRLGNRTQLPSTKYIGLFIYVQYIGRVLGIPRRGWLIFMRSKGDVGQLFDRRGLPLRGKLAYCALS